MDQQLLEPLDTAADQQPSPDQPAPVAVLELSLAPGDANRLLRATARAGARRGRKRALTVTMHDSADGALATQGLALSHVAKGHWTLRRLHPGSAEPWPPGSPAPVLAGAADLARLGLPAVLPIASFEGQSRALHLGAADDIALTLFTGEICAFHGRGPHAWLTLEGPAALLAPLTRALAAEVPLAPPRASLAAEALAYAAGKPLPPYSGGPPEAPQGAIAGDAFAVILAHLCRTIIEHLREVATSDAPEPVHQARVALRRLRAAIGLFAPILDASVSADIRPGLRHLGAQLGAARDWDVFVTETGARAAEAVPDRRMAVLLASADRRRAAARSALIFWLNGAEGRGVLLELALLSALSTWRPSVGTEPQESPAEAGVLAAAHFARRHRRILRMGADLEHMTPDEQHELRKQCKKLRYTVEPFRTCFPARPTRRFLSRLEDLQAELGHANDAATSGTLLHNLGGAGRGWAAGAVAGYLAARAAKSGRRIADAWEDFRKAEPFWT